MNFLDLNVTSRINDALVQFGYKEATEIQIKAIPIILDGKDLLASAQTGTGKTAAFAIPMLQKFSLRKKPKGKRKIKGLIISPTRELAQQIYESYETYGKYLNLKVGVIYGGVSQKRQERFLQNGVDIQEKEFARQASKGYSVEQVDYFLDEIVEQFEAILLENIALKNRVTECEGALDDPEDRHGDMAAFDQLTSGVLSEVQSEKRYIRKDGRPVWVAINVRLIHDDHGHNLCTIASVQDITERRRGEEALRHTTEHNERNLAQLRSIVQAMTEGLVICDLRQHLTFNPAAMEMFGFQ